MERAIAGPEELDFRSTTTKAILDRTYRMAEERRKRYTDAEKHLEGILNDIADGAICGTFIHEFPFNWWILDFFLYEVRVAIEVDGGYHTEPDQRERDARKSSDCERTNMTMLRLSNDEVLFGDRRALERKLVETYQEGLRRTGGRFIQHNYTHLSLQPSRELTPTPQATTATPGPEAITWVEAQLLKKWGAFYRKLETRELEPKTAAQRQFVDVCEGTREATTMDEIAYLKLIRCRTL